jgi:DNA-binding response OmpR family regulator
MSETSSNNLGLRGSGDRQVCVLVVEDDPALQRMILNYFGENNIRTLVASGRQEMLSLLGDTEVSLVILDLGSVRRTAWICYEGPIELRRAGHHRTGHRRDDIDRVVGLELAPTII